MSYACRILAIDGGGIRGAIPATILTQIEAALGKPIYQCFDIIAGTSTGGLIALALTTPVIKGNQPTPPMAAADVLNMYMNDEGDIFKKQTGNNGATYQSIAPWLQSILGKLTLSQAAQLLPSLGHAAPKQVLTTCYTINGAPAANIGPYLFNWVDAFASAADNYYVWEAALATSSAPTYFPLAQVGQGATNGSSATGRRGADGGVVANNPALYALAWAWKLGLCATIKDVLVVSLGTGLYNAAIQIGNGGNWNTYYWGDGKDVNNNPAVPLLDVLSNSNVLAPDAQLQYTMPPGNYYRLEPAVSYAESQMDGTDTAALKQTAVQYTSPGGQGYNAYQSVIEALGPTAGLFRKVG